jgi:hypothetical protein
MHLSFLFSLIESSPGASETPYLFNKNESFPTVLLVQSPQPTSNPNQTQNQKQAFLHKVLEDEVVGLASLLLLI